ncbi:MULTISPECIES: response regulator [unclassified Streptococcus]|uniref:response regulator transcription factor n=1 Tax=unclassified Streptococcus TaxID=2608887 RepID=UPI0010718680|nr:MULTISPECIES: response regulator [unclassified Streptococcus]MBF0806621.1 response regulator [Streptococcus sp. 19428wA2_WM07]TFU27019.1 response regulator [Streptococcus sp. WM07]
MYKIMIVEDEYLVRQGISSLVDYDALGMTIVAEAEDGLEAWEFLSEEPVDILVTDINMPRMDGLRLAQLVKKQFPKTHVVFLTGYDDFDYALSAVKLGLDDYLLKPFSKSDIEQMLQEVKQKLDQENQYQCLQAFINNQEESEFALYIKEHLADSELSLKSMAQAFGYSVSHLSLLLKQEFGQPFQDYVVQERIQWAKLLLWTTDLRIYEIAEQVGFEDMNYFSHRFKQIVGLTPRQFKKGDGK